MTPIVTPTEMAAIDAAAPEPVEELIRRAGWAVARSALDLLGGTHGRRVVVLAGKGNNGADGREAARILERRGIRCTVLDATDPAAGPDVALPSCDLIVDAAYGTGFHGSYVRPRPPSPDVPVLAVDIPSGIDGVTGSVSGRPWVATRTVTFAALKPGLLLGAGPDHAGSIEIADIGLDTSSARAHHVGPADLAELVGDRLVRPRDLHKWQRAVWVVAGSPGMDGAAALTSGAALRAGAGYVRLSTPGGTAGPHTPTEVVQHPFSGEEWADEVRDGVDRFGAVAVGPGLGRTGSTDGQVRRLVASLTVPTLVDGDGIGALGAVDEVRDVIASRPADAAPVVLTPHDGEHRGLTGEAPAADRVTATRDLAEATGAIVLLKGPTTVVADPHGRVRAVTAGDARLATAGTGDVLSGITVALLTAGIDPLDAATTAAVLHGRAGELASPRGLIASDLLDHLPTALTEAFGE